jgi:putative addiction module CopG family antidote
MILMSSAANVLSLPEDLQAFAEERVRAGEYASVGEVAEEAFRLLQQRDERRHQVREDLAAVFSEMDAGTYLEPSDDEFEQAVQARARIRSAE